MSSKVTITLGLLPRTLRPEPTKISFFLNLINGSVNHYATGVVIELEVFDIILYFFKAKDMF